MKYRLFVILAAASLLSNAGCARAVSKPPEVAPIAGFERSSPWQTALGAGVRLPVGAAGDWALYGIGGYQIQFFDGGHDNVFTVGAHARRPVGRRGTWFAAEGTYNSWRVSGGPAANVVGFSGLVGHPVRERIDIFGSFGMLLFSDFKQNGAAVFPGGTGWQVNGGVSFKLGQK